MFANSCYANTSETMILVMTIASLFIISVKVETDFVFGYGSFDCFFRAEVLFCNHIFF